MVLAAIMFESHAWRQTVWRVADDAGVVESQVHRQPSGRASRPVCDHITCSHTCSAIISSSRNTLDVSTKALICQAASQGSHAPVQAWRSLMKDFVDKFPHWPIG